MIPLIWLISFICLYGDILRFFSALIQSLLITCHVKYLRIRTKKDNILSRVSAFSLCEISFIMQIGICVLWLIDRRLDK